jgi:hypothetical protein
VHPGSTGVDGIFTLGRDAFTNFPGLPSTPDWLAKLTELSIGPGVHVNSRKRLVKALSSFAQAPSRDRKDC